MIEKPTLFVLGAGASCPYGYKTGFYLRKDIIDNLPTYFRGFKDQELASLEEDIIKEFIHVFSNTPTSISIDRFLQFNNNFQHIGK